MQHQATHSHQYFLQLVTAMCCTTIPVPGNNLSTCGLALGILHAYLLALFPHSTSVTFRHLLWRLLASRNDIIQAVLDELIYKL